MDEWLREKDELRRICGELSVDALWHPDATESTCETEHHMVRVIRYKNGKVHLELWRK